MATLPIWAIGKHLTAVVLTPQSVSTAGVLADTTPVATLTGYWDEVDPASENTMEMIQAADTRREHDVITGSRTGYTITEILKSNDSTSSATNLLRRAAYGSADVFKVALAADGLTWTGYGIFRSYREEHRRGKKVGRAEFGMVDGGSANPVLT